MKWNEAQLGAIMTRNSNILVSAAAGSGKTAVLTERIKRLVTREGTGIDEMLIVTFTNAAAGEMRERIFKGISEAMEEEGADLPYLQEQLDKIGKANISTFHAFCMEVIREYFYLTELSPDFRICDDAQKAIYDTEAMDDLINEFFDKENNGDFLKFVRKYSKAGNEKGVTDMIRMVYNYIRSLPAPFEWLNESVEKLKDSEDPYEKSTYGDACVLRDMVVRYHEIFMSKKMSANQPDFNDVEHLALKILENPEPCSEYRERFRHIFIDEYQDTNAVQEELINRIKRDDNLFMVGDVKQSIYQFRLADPQIFIDKYKEYRDGDGSGGIKIDLNRNFRSKPSVLEAANRVMTEIMTDETCGISYDESAMLYPGFDYGEEDIISSGTEKVKLDVIVESRINERLSESGDIAEKIKSTELEALFICGRIKEVLGREYFDFKENRIKKVTYDDIVVLMRAYKGSADIYQEIFQREGIPAYVEGNDGYFETVEISVFANLIRIIANKRQDIPLLSVMRSAMFGFSPDEMSEIRLINKDGLFSEAFLAYCREGQNEALRSKCCEMLERLDRWKDESGYMSLKDFLWKLAEESGFYDFIGALPLGSRRIRNLKTLIEKAEKYQRSTSGGLTGFIRYMELMELNSAKMSYSRPEGENEGCVKMMSIHKSKGLEFPVVITAGLGKGFNHRKASGEISLDRNLGLGLRFRDDSSEYYMKTQRQLDIDAAVREKELAEEMRILYVAMTRAREELILIGTVKKLDDTYPGEGKLTQECKCFLEWVCGPLEGAAGDGRIQVKYHTVLPEEYYPSELTEPEAIEEVSPEENDEKDERAEKQDTAAEETEESEEKRIRDEVFAEYDFSYPYKEAAGMSGKFTATELNRLTYGDSLDRLPEIYSKRESDAGGREGYASFIGEINREIPVWKENPEKISAAEKGTAVHKVLQELDFSLIGSENEINDQIDRMVTEEKLTEREKEAVSADRIFRMFESDLGKRMKSAEKVYREKSFLLWRPFDDETGSIVQGIIDCFFIEDGEAVLVDYKTDFIPHEGGEAAALEKSEKYRTQIDIYKEAVEKSMGLRVKEAYLYFLSSGTAVRM
ncbi:MAG: UvrD-helicase domain-containing protein [Bacillota bacterium]|nr:UvrD-helicase domain-containing protein [Bacillota bacterium]